MNNFVRPVPLTENPRSSYINNMARASNAHHIVGGPGVNVSRNANSTTITLNDLNLPTYMKFAGVYDFDKAYFPGEVVIVPPDQEYTDEHGFSLPYGTTDVSGYVNDEGSPIIPIAMGLFHCDKPVGPEFMNDGFITNNILSHFANLPDGYIKYGRWFHYNVYYPIYPPIPQTNTVSVPLHGNFITANDTFWTALPIGAYVTKGCANGSQVTKYDMFAISGSVFQSEYIPYSG